MAALRALFRIPPKSILANRFFLPLFGAFAACIAGFLGCASMLSALFGAFRRFSALFGPFLSFVQRATDSIGFLRVHFKHLPSSGALARTSVAISAPFDAFRHFSVLFLISCNAPQIPLDFSSGNRIISRKPEFLYYKHNLAWVSYDILFSNARLVWWFWELFCTYLSRFSRNGIS